MKEFVHFKKLRIMYNDYIDTITNTNQSTEVLTGGEFIDNFMLKSAKYYFAWQVVPQLYMNNIAHIFSNINFWLFLEEF